MRDFTGRDGKSRTRFHQAERERQGRRCGARYPHHKVGLATEGLHIHCSYDIVPTRQDQRSAADRRSCGGILDWASCTHFHTAARIRDWELIRASEARRQ